MRHDAIYNVVTGTIQQVSMVSYEDITTNTLLRNLNMNSYINVWEETMINNELLSCSE